MDKKSAFSLVELMVAVGIVGVLVTLAVPRYHQFMVQARRGEAKSNLSHIATLQETYKVDHFSYYSGAAMSGTNGIGYRDGSGYDGSCDDPATDVDEGINNHLGFRPNGCGQLRYFYQLRNSGNTAVASAASDAKGRHIYPDCSGGGAPECGYASGDAVLLAMNSGKSEVCRNITNYCPGSSTTLTPPPTICPPNTCCDASNNPITTCPLLGQTLQPHPQCCTTTPPPTCPPGESMMGGQCCSDTKRMDFDWCTAVSGTWNNCGPCCYGPCCQSGTMRTGYSSMDGQCCSDTKRTEYINCLPPNQWTGCDCVLAACTCVDDNINDPANLSTWSPSDLSPYWTCESIRQSRRQYRNCYRGTNPNSSDDDYCYDHYASVPPRDKCGTKPVTCTNVCSFWSTSWDPCAETSPGTWEEIGTKTRNCGDPCSVSEGACPSFTITPPCETSTAVTPLPCSPSDVCMDSTPIDTAKLTCESGDQHFSKTLHTAPNIYTCTCQDACDTFNGRVFARLSLSSAERLCGRRGGDFQATPATGRRTCTCNPTCATVTDTAGNLSTPGSTLLASDAESNCSTAVGVETSFDHDSFGDDHSSTIASGCSGVSGAIPYRFTRDASSRACTCTAPIRKGAFCAGQYLAAMINIQVGSATFNSVYHELAACYKPCLSETTLAAREQCYADALDVAMNIHNLPDSGRACEATHFYNSYNYKMEGRETGKNCGRVEGILDTFKNNMTGARCGEPPYIWIQAP